MSWSVGPTPNSTLWGSGLHRAEQSRFNLTTSSLSRWLVLGPYPWADGARVYHLYTVWLAVYIAKTSLESWLEDIRGSEFRRRHFSGAC